MSELTYRFITITQEEDRELDEHVQTARDAAEGDSNDAEIEALQDALDVALSMLGRRDLR